MGQGDTLSKDDGDSSNIATITDWTTPLTAEQMKRTYNMWGDNSHLAPGARPNNFRVPLHITATRGQENVDFRETEISDILQFYKEHSGWKVATTAINRGEFAQVFEEIKGRNFKYVYCLLLPNKLSATCQEAQFAAAEVTGLEVFAPSSISGSGEALIILDELARNYDRGFTYVKQLGEMLTENSRLYLTPDRLNRLLESGRISPLRHLVGLMANMIPILTVMKEGEHEGDFKDVCVVRNKIDITIDAILDRTKAYLGERKAIGCVVNHSMDDSAQRLWERASELDNFRYEVGGVRYNIPIVKDRSPAIEVNVGPAFELAMLPHYEGQ